jgi:hypothetical protein
MREYGFGTMPHSDRSHAIALHENLAAITAWRDSLPERERIAAFAEVHQGQAAHASWQPRLLGSRTLP